MFKKRLDFQELSHLTARLLLSSLISLSLTFTAFAQSDSAEAQSEGAASEEAAPEEAAQGGGADGIPTSEAAISEGSSIFKNNCAVCHAIDAQVVGPALKGVTERRPLPWLISFISNSQKVISSGDEYAVQLYNKFNKTVMPPFTSLSEDQIKSVLGYIQSESNAAPAADAQAGGDGATAANQGERGGTQSGGIASEYLTIILIGLIVVLVLILLVLVLIISVLTRFLNQRTDLDEEDREIINRQTNYKKIVTSSPFIGIAIFIFLTIAVKVGLDGLYSVGIQQGYMPKQPIAFSHELHAGQYEIPCQYCHTGVMKSKTANIPSANICMNCHQEIKTESPEIQKIFAAIDFDPETRTYGNNKKPIEWVRVHNLPDLAYFSHAQHVNVGGLECQTCHGPIQEMPVVYQYANLTMGWCINCHRETQVNAKGNAYYDKLVELHQAANPNEPMTVDNIGGLECSKCHY